MRRNLNTASVRIETPKQGEDAYIEIRSPKLSFIRRADRLDQAEDTNNLDLYEFLIEMLTYCIVDWNWMDEAPTEENELIWDLTEPELLYLYELISESEDSKN